MKIQSYTGWMAAFVLLVGLMFAVESQPQTRSIYVYFFVAPAQLPDGSSSNESIIALKKFLAETAGGYTEVGMGEGGFLNDQGVIETERNHSFMVSSPRDISLELREFIIKQFLQDYPYILTWQVRSVDDLYASSVPMWSAVK